MYIGLFITSVTAVLLTPLLIGLIFKVVIFRRKNKISLGHANHPELIIRTRAHANFIENTPFFLILLGLCEAQSAHTYIIFFVAILFTLGRYLHAFGILNQSFKLRVPGMILTIMPIILISVTLIFSLFNS